MGKHRIPPKVIWACIQDEKDAIGDFAEGKRNVCKRYFFGENVCSNYANGCRPVKYIRADGHSEGGK